MIDCNGAVGVLEISAEGIVLDSNEIGQTPIGATDPTGAPVADAFPRSVGDTLLPSFEGASVTETDFEECYPVLDRSLAVSVVALDQGGTVYLGDVTERRREKQFLQRLRQERKRTELRPVVTSPPD